MQVKDLILEFRMMVDKDRRKCSACGGTFNPDNKQNVLEKRCQACRLLGNQKGQNSDDQPLGKLLKTNLSQRNINVFVDKLTPYEVDNIEKEDLEDLIWQVLDELSDRERDVIQLLYGLNSEKSTYTIEEVATILGLTNSRIRTIEASSIKKLRGPKVKNIFNQYSQI